MCTNMQSTKLIHLAVGETALHFHRLGILYEFYGIPATHANQNQFALLH